jgi:alpha-mannosidase
LEFHTELDWHDRRVLLKTRFPLAIKADHALFECACGVIARPTHRNTPWDVTKFEVPAHRFALMAERGFGLALLNDGKYGHHALGNELGISLLRSPVWPTRGAKPSPTPFCPSPAIGLTAVCWQRRKT